MRQPDFDSRSYRYAKLSDLMAATTLFDLERRSTLLLDGEAVCSATTSSLSPDGRIDLRASLTPDVIRDIAGCPARPLSAGY